MLHFVETPNLTASSPSSSAKTLQSERFWRILAATWLAYATYSMLRRPLSIVRSEMISDGDMSIQESGAIDTCFLIFYTLGQLYYSSIRTFLGNLRSRRILTLGLAGSAVCVLLFGLIPFRSPALSVCRCALWAALGLVQAVGWASCLIVLTPWLAPSERGKVMGLWGTNMAIGGVLGNTISSAVLSETGGSWVAVFLVCAGYAGAVAFSLPFWLGSHPNSLGILTAAQSAKISEIRAGSKLEHSGQSDFADACFYNDEHVDVEGEWMLQNPSLAKVAALGSVGEHIAISSVAASSHGSSNDNNNSNNDNISNNTNLLLTQHVSKIPGVLGIAISYFFHKLVRYVLMMWMPFYLSKQLKIDAAAAGYMSISFDIGGIVGTIGSGFLADFVGGGNRKALTVTGFAVAMAMTLSGFASGINEPSSSSASSSSSSSSTAAIITLVLCFLAGAFSFGIDSLMTGSLLQDHCEKLGVSSRIGAIGAFVGAIGTLGSILQGLITVIFSGYSWASLFMMMVLMTVIAICSLMPVVKTEMISSMSVSRNV